MNNINKEIKQSNYTTIFRLIQNGPISRREIEKYSSLSWGTVSSVTADLIQNNLIKGFKDSNLSLGRTPDKLMVNDDNIFFLGIDINIIGITFVVSDLSFKIHEVLFKEIKVNKKENILNELYDTTSLFINKYNIFYISISMQGQIEKGKGISKIIERFDDWVDVKIVELFENKFQIKTFLYHDPDCLLTYHRRVSKEKIQNAENVLLLKIDDGIGLSMMINKTILESSFETVSEIGHVCVDIDGRKCKCNKNGCLEAYFSLDSLTSIYNENTNKKISSKNFLYALDNKNTEAIKTIKDNSKYLGMALSNILNLIDFKLIIIDGLMSKYLKYYIDELKEFIRKNTRNNFEIYIANYSRNGAALGASIKTINENLTSILFEIIKD